MPVYQFSQETIPSTAKLHALFRQADETYDPLEELLRLERELAQLEAEHGMSSSEFFKRYQAGEMGDAVEVVTWAGRYRLYLNLKRAISESLRVVVTVASPLS
ncbi:hypothetical protein [Promineifilum sp.]|uniref:hypothetical protein n=1 Tax=Promineifilum sp. TaxID=2664178 RepID=UPI0035B0E28C